MNDSKSGGGAGGGGGVGVGGGDQDFAEWKNAEVLQFARKQAELDEEDCAILQKNKLRGKHLAKLKQEELERWGVPGGSAKDLVEAIREQLLKLPPASDNEVVALRAENAELKSQLDGSENSRGSKRSWSSMSEVSSYYSAGGGRYGGKRRDSKKQSALATALRVLHPNGCLITNESASAAHIVELKYGHNLEARLHYSTSNAIPLRKDLEESYDFHHWYFEADGRIVVQFPRCEFKTVLEQKAVLTLRCDDDMKTCLAVRNKLARDYADFACPDCWELVGPNSADHRRHSCVVLQAEAKTVPRPNNPAAFSDICQVGVEPANLEAHNAGKKHQKKLTGAASNSKAEV